MAQLFARLDTEDENLRKKVERHLKKREDRGHVETDDSDRPLASRLESIENMLLEQQKLIQLLLDAQGPSTTARTDML